MIKAKGRYFVDESGAPFMVVGHNEGLMWPYIRELWNLPPEQADKIVSEYFAKLSNAGVNTIRIFAEYPGDGVYLQNPDGTLVEENWQRLERLADIADQHNIYLLLGPWDPFWTEHKWELDPMNAANGGPLKEIGDFYRSPKAREHQRTRLKALIDRFGSRRNILAWEILNEADLWWKPEPQLVMDWYREMAKFIADYETKRWGRRHMIGLSAGKPIPSPEWRTLFYNNPQADFVSTHLYVYAVADPFSPVEATRQVHDAMLLQMELIGKNLKPYLETENGPIDPFVFRKGEIVPPDLDTQVYNTICWTHVIQGGAGQPLRWPYMTHHTLTEEMQRTQTFQKKFFERFTFSDYDPFPITAKTSLQEPVNIVSAAADDNQLIASVVFDTKPSIESLEITFTHRLTENQYNIEWMDANSGEILLLENRSITAGAPLTLSIPKANRHTIVSIQPQDCSNESPPDAPNPKFNVSIQVEAEPETDGMVEYSLYHPRWGRESHQTKAGEALEVTLPIGDWRVRAWTDGYMPGEILFATDTLQNRLTVPLVKTPVSAEKDFVYISNFQTETDLAFWKVAAIEGEGKASMTVQDGALCLANPAGSRSGAMSPRFRLAEGDSITFEGVLSSYEGPNAIVSLYGGDGGFNKFVELEITSMMLNTWTSVQVESRRFYPTTVNPPVCIACEVERDEKGVHLTSTYNGRVVQEMKNIRSLADTTDLSVFLYGWDAKNKWSFIRIEGVIMEKMKSPSQSKDH